MPWWPRCSHRRCWREQQGQVEIGIEEVFVWSDGLDDADDGNLYFSPNMGNVVFCSAVVGWAFSLNTFAKIYSKKLGFSESILQRTLWGDKDRLKKIV
jgi:ribosome assembly protein 1